MFFIYLFFFNMAANGPQQMIYCTITQKEKTKYKTKMWPDM